MNNYSKYLILFIEFIQNILKFIQIITISLGIITILYWTMSQIQNQIIQDITFALGVFMTPLIGSFKSIYSLATQHEGRVIDVTPIILSGGLYGVAYIIGNLIILTNITAAKVFEIADDISYKIEEKEKTRLLNKIKTETLKYNNIHFHLTFSLTQNSISDLTEEINLEEVKQRLTQTIKQASQFECVKTIKLGQDYSFILTFNSKTNILNFIKFIEEEIENFNNHASSCGLDIDYKGAIECTKELESPEILPFLRKIIRFGNKNEIMISCLAKKYIECDEGHSLAFEITGKGIYTTDNDTLELFNLKLATPSKCKQY